MHPSVYLYCEGCVINCGYLWGARYVPSLDDTGRFKINCNAIHICFKHTMQNVFDSIADDAAKSHITLQSKKLSVIHSQYHHISALIM